VPKFRQLTAAAMPSAGKTNCGIRLRGYWRPNRALTLQREDKHESTHYSMSIALLSLVACAFPQASFAQSSPLIGSWKLNLEKSKLTPVTPPRSQTATFQQDGQNIKNTNQTIDAQGNTTTSVLLHIYDGQPHPTTGNPLYDSSAYLRLDGNTVVFSRFKVENSSKSAPSQYLRTASQGQILPAASSGRTVSRVLPFLSMTSSRSFQFKE
jgi:hypothetical protein